MDTKKIEKLKHKISIIPSSPGVYLMKNKKGKNIYIGKSNNLKHRVSSYFQPSSLSNRKINNLVNEIEDFEYIITSSEMEALILECNLIMEYRPKYNVKFKDGKGYPYIKINIQEDFPYMEISKKISNDGARYYGPYTKGLRNYLKLFESLFPMRKCRGKINIKPGNRPCMDYHIKKCPGICIGEANQESYREIVKKGCKFLEGKHNTLMNSLTEKINKCAEELRFEEAAKLRDQLYALKNYSEKQNVVFSSPEEEGDFIGTDINNAMACVELYRLREGTIINQERFFLDNFIDSSKSELISSFIKRFYINNSTIPSKIYIEEPTDDMELLEEWAKIQKKGLVKIIIPRKGKKRDLIEMAKNNAGEHLKNKINQELQDKEKAGNSIMELKDRLNLTYLPLLIEAFDISNISGKDAVGSMVTFKEGLPEKSLYRRFKIRNKSTPDDYAMLEEVIGRRYKKLTEDPSSPWPDLILIDGGKGQLNIAINTLKELNIKIPVISIAKEEELIFKEDYYEPVKLPADSKALYLLQMIRDEAHRFAITYHRKLRQERTLKSLLDEIPGIGNIRKNRLLKHFGSLETISRTSPEEIASLPGMNKKIAEQIISYFFSE